MNFGKHLAIASLIISLPVSCIQAQNPRSIGPGEIPPQLFYVIDIGPNQPQAIPTSTPTATLPTPCGPHSALSIAWNKNSTLMAVGVRSGTNSCGLSGSLQIFDMSSGYPRLLRFVRATDFIGSVTFSPDGTLLVTGGDDDTVNVFEGVSPFKHLQTLIEGQSDIETVAINSNGTLLAAGGKDTDVRLYVKNRRNLFTYVKTLTDARNYIQTVDFHPINGQLAVGESGNRVRIYSGTNPYNLLKNFFIPGARLLTVAYSHDGTLLASADDRKKINLYNGTNPGNPLQTLTAPRRILSIAFNRKATQLLVGHINGYVSIYVITPLSNVFTDTLPFVKSPLPAHALAFSPDGKWLSVGRTEVAIYRVDGVRAPTTQASTTETITTVVITTAVNTTAVNTTAVNTTEATTTEYCEEPSPVTRIKSNTEMGNSSTLTALSLIALLTAVLQGIILQ
ncbi:WD40 repeat domain-containing protein [Endozoicomonas sp. ALB032]|uniref:WD40 repeat domain-containing protein n=1 Tax=Endozoicomonas sp. ALB032 TaxID=3403082 RepID=UPI003BB61FF3